MYYYGTFDSSCKPIPTQLQIFKTEGCSKLTIELENMPQQQGLPIVIQIGGANRLLGLNEWARARPFDDINVWGRRFNEHSCSTDTF
jgi:hypothetical protein